MIDVRNVADTVPCPRCSSSDDQTRPSAQLPSARQWDAAHDVAHRLLAEVSGFDRKCDQIANTSI